MYRTVAKTSGGDSARPGQQYHFGPSGDKVTQDSSSHV